MLKIIGGEFRSRQLLAPVDDSHTRPYIGRIRESVFNLLRGWFEEASVLDLFAGVGSMGLEAISRGAASVLMVENNRSIYDLLIDNIQTLDCADRGEAMFADALGSACLLRASTPVDLIFIDPPFQFMKRPESRQRVFDQASRCREIMADPSFLVLRTPLDPDQTDHRIAGLDGPEIHQFGPMWVLLYAPAAEETD